MVDTFSELEHRLQHLLDAHPRMYSYFKYVASWEVGLDFNAKFRSERYKKHSCTQKEKGQSYTNCVQQVDDMIDRMSKTIKKQIFKAYENRIEELKGEGTKINIGAETDFWSFLGKMPIMREGTVVLFHAGFLQIAWKDDKGNILSMTFLGNRKVECIVIKKNYGHDSSTRMLSCSLREAEGLIDKHDLRFLVRIKHD